MEIISTKISGVNIIETNAIADDRGCFSRAFCNRELKPVLEGRMIAQINISTTIKMGAIRGLHYQRTPFAEMKLVRCLRGRVLDVALDLREGSPTFLQWHAEILTPENMKMMVVPERCAHGFQVLEPGSELLYLHTQYYEPSAEGGVHYADPLHKINWPLPATDLSSRDSSLAFLDSRFRGI